MRKIKGRVQIVGNMEDRHIAKYHRRVMAILLKQLGLTAEQTIRKYEGGLGNEYLWDIFVYEDPPSPNV